MTNNKKGFTLIELLVVIAIIGILSAIGLVSLNGAREKARDAQRKTDLATMRTALALYFDDHSNAYPGATVITGVPENVSANFTTKMGSTGGNYLPTIPAATGAGSTCTNANNYWYSANNTVSNADTSATNGHFALFAQLEASGCKLAYILTDQGNSPASGLAEGTANSFGLAKCGAATDVCVAQGSFPASI